MAKEASPNYSVVKQERGWCWCSYAVQEIRGRGGLVGPFPSQEEAEKMPGRRLHVEKGNNDRS
jgi:hypothetical protein